MTEGGFPEDVRRLIEDSIPTLEALEIMLLLSRDPGREWQVASIPPLLHPTIVTEADVLAYLRVLVGQGIVSARPASTFVYEPRTPVLVKAIEGLIVAYHQRPVTLVRMVYASADLKNIRTFADAFRLRKKD